MTSADPRARETPTSRRLASRDPNDHPNATVQRCQIKRPHPRHPYGAIHPDGGLSFWCRGWL